MEVTTDSIMYDTIVIGGVLADMFVLLEQHNLVATFA